jgi:phosphoribosylglycinamide formyltransferase 1
VAAGRAGTIAAMTGKNLKNVVVLISGRGSNLEAILKTAASEKWDESPGARVVAVISNRADAEGLAIARAFRVPTQIVAHADHSSREAFDDALAAAIDAHLPALVVLAGFMRVLTPSFVSRYEGRMINIHPSLLPLFPGLGTHRRALDAGVRVHGATVHFVSPTVDSGPIIAQAAVAVHPDDDEARLAARVLEQEHRLLPRAVRLVLEGRARCEGARVVLHGVEPGELSLLAS